MRAANVIGQENFNVGRFGNAQRFVDVLEDGIFVGEGRAMRIVTKIGR